MNIHRNQSKRSQYNETGAVVLLFAMLAATFLGLAALVVDRSKQEVNMIELKNAAEAAAHAMALQLDGTLPGWLRAKRAGVKILQQYGVRGAADSLQVPLSAIEGSESDPFETPGGPFEYNMGSGGGVTIELHRGLVGNFFDPTNSATDAQFKILGDAHSRYDELFRSFEGESSIYGEKPYHLASAAIVFVQVSGIRNIFSRVFDEDTSPDVLAVGAAVFDTTNKDPFLPFAIPVCQMRYNPEAPYDQDTVYEDPKIDKQCYREMLLTEVKYGVWEGIDGDNDRGRIGGFQRYKAYQPYMFVAREGSPYYPAAMLSERLLLHGGLGVYGERDHSLSWDEDDDVRGSGSAEELQELLEENGGRSVVTIGTSFKPIVWGSTYLCNNAGAYAAGDTCGDVKGHLENPYNTGISNALGALFSASTKTYQSDVECTPDFLNPDNCPEFPTFSWPSLYKARPTDAMPNRIGWTWIAGHAPDTFTNPLCHSAAELGAANSMTQKILLNHRVALVAPTAVDDNGDPAYKYCPWSDGPGEFSPMLPKTQAVVVGSVEASVLNFNLMELSDPLTPIDKNPAGWFPYAPGVPPNPPDPYGCYAIPQAIWEQIRTTFELITGISLDGVSLNQWCEMVNDPCIFRALMDSGYVDHPQFNWFGGDTPIDPVCAANPLPQKDCDPGIYEDWVPYYPPNKEDPTSHCLPVWYYAPDSFMYLFAEHWQLQPNYGCGGAQARLKCQDETIAGQNPRGAEQPRIISLDATS